MKKYWRKLKKPKNLTAKIGNIQGVPISVRGSVPSYLLHQTLLELCSYSR